MKLVILALLTLTFVAHATPQAGDKMTAEGHVVYAHGFELNPKLEKRIKKVEDRRSYTISSTANYDGFYATLEIVKGRLMLKRLWIDADKDKFPDGREAIRLRWGRGLFDRPPIHARWFSGELRSYHGKSLGYIHIKSKVRIYEFKKGMLIGIRDENTDGTK